MYEPVMVFFQEAIADIEIKLPRPIIRVCFHFIFHHGQIMDDVSASYNQYSTLSQE